MTQIRSEKVREEVELACSAKWIQDRTDTWVASLVTRVEEIVAKEAFEAGMRALWAHLSDKDMLTDWANYGKKVIEDGYTDYLTHSWETQGEVKP